MIRVFISSAASPAVLHWKHRMKGIAVSMIMVRLRREVRILRARASFRRNRVAHGIRPSMEYSMARIENEGTISLGARARLSCAESRSLVQVRPGATLLVGDRAFINSGVTITVSARIEIGNDVKIGANVAISDSGGHELVAGDGIKSSPVRIGNNVWLGRGAFVLPGVTIGDNAIVGAGSVVSRDVAADTVVAGVPARPLRTLRPSSAARH